MKRQHCTDAEVGVGSTGENPARGSDAGLTSLIATVAGGLWLVQIYQSFWLLNKVVRRAAIVRGSIVLMSMMIHESLRQQLLLRTLDGTGLYVISPTRA